jgi:hypothetical protein
MPESTYSVYLVQHRGEQGGKRQVTSPVEGHRLEFYDTGVWLDRETGRNFFPYEQIRTIRERPTEETGEDGPSSDEGEERPPERSEEWADEEMEEAQEE